MNAPDHGTSAPPVRTPPPLPKAPPLLIGLVGAPHCGRKTIAKLLKHHHGFAMSGFHQPVYEAIQSLYGVSPVDLFFQPTETITRLGKSPNELIQLLRDHGEETAGSGLLIQRLVERTTARGEWKQQDLVITDVTKAVEIHWLRLVGGSVWWIRRPLEPGVIPLIDEVGKLALNEWHSGDMAIVNDGSIDALTFKVASLMERARRMQEAPAP